MSAMRSEGARHMTHRAQGEAQGSAPASFVVGSDDPSGTAASM
jgi:hypothetical protein